MSNLDPKFAKIVALMNSTTHEGEKQAARKRAEAVAASCGMTFDEALKVLAAKPESAPFVDMMAGFDDFMERKEPGYKAERAAEKIKKAQDRRARVIELLLKYGSKESVIAPCEKERLLREALKPWIRYRNCPHERWTDSIEGDRGYFVADIPAHIRAAIEKAYPLPKTVCEAKAEYDYWRVREIEIEDILDDDGRGESPLDRPAYLRMDLVRDLAEKDIQATTLADLLARFKMYEDRGSYDREIDAALFRDVEAMAKAEADLSTVTLSTPPEPQEAKAERGDKESLNLKITDLLWSNMKASDRTIARACGCSPTTVGKVRKRLGFSQIVRCVERSGQTYPMRPPQR